MSAAGLKKIIFLTILLFYLLNPSRVEGNYIYGGVGRPGQILVDKTIKNPISGEWFDNLDSSLVVFSAQNIIDFKIKVKNTGDKKLSNINITEILPPYVDFLSGPGEYKSDSRELSWSIGELEAGGEQLYDLQLKVWEAEKLPQGGTICVANRVEAEAEGQKDVDTSQFCLETRILAEEIPKAGIDPQLALQVTACLMMMGMGLKLRKYR